MALSQTTITGPVYLPGCDKPEDAKITFELSSWDREEGEAVFVTGPYVASLDVNGDFTATIFTSAEGENDVVYRVAVVYKTGLGQYKRDLLGTIAISGPGPYQLSDLEFVSEWSESSFDLLAQVAAYKVDAENSLASITSQIAAFDAVVDRAAADYDALDVITAGDMVVGEYWRVLEGNVYVLVVSSGEDVTLSNGVKIEIITNPEFPQLTTATATEFVKWPNGTVGYLAGTEYVVDSSLTGGASATNSVSVDGTDVTGNSLLQEVLTNLSLTQTGRDMIEAASVAAQRTLLELGGAALKEEASVAEIRGNSANKLVGTNNSWLAAVPVSVSYAASLTLDFSTFFDCYITLTGDCQLQLPSNAKVGQSGLIEFIQDGTGTRLLTFVSGIKFAGGVDLILSTVGGSVDLLFYKILRDGSLFLSMAADVKS